MGAALLIELWTMATMVDDDDEGDESSASTEFLQSYVRNLQVGDSDDDERDDAGRSAGDEEADATKPVHGTIIRPSFLAAYSAATAATSTTVTLDELMRMMSSPTATAEDARKILLTTMGNIALCRGDHGKKLHQAGAVPALTQLLTRVLQKQRPDRNDNGGGDNATASLLLLPILAAIRDLSCGNPTIRADFYHLLPVLTDVLVQRNEQSVVVFVNDDVDDVDDEDGEPRDNNHNGIATLPFQTALVGTLRNLAHSNGRNGRRLHELAVTVWLVSYLQQQQQQQRRQQHDTLSSSPPPPPSSPHRELYFRAVGTLLAIVEKVDAAIPLAMSVTDQCLMDDKALPSSPPATASTKPSTRTAAKLYHPGLLKLIRASHERQPQDRYAILLNQEAKRQAAARLREAQQQQQRQRVVVVAKDR